MTWRKTGAEFDAECDAVEMTDAAYRTHVEGIGYIYETSAMTCSFAKRKVSKFANSTDAERGVRELLDLGFWRDLGDRYEVLHHADVIRQSLAAQSKKLLRDKKAQQAHRDRKRAESQEVNSTSETPPVSADVSADTDRQTDRQLESAGSKTCHHGNEVTVWPCMKCQWEAKSA